MLIIIVLMNRAVNAAAALYTLGDSDREPSELSKQLIQVACLAPDAALGRAASGARQATSDPWKENLIRALVAIDDVPSLLDDFNSFFTGNLQDRRHIRYLDQLDAVKKQLQLRNEDELLEDKELLSIGDILCLFQESAWPTDNIINYVAMILMLNPTIAERCIIGSTRLYNCEQISSQDLTPFLCTALLKSELVTTVMIPVYHKNTYLLFVGQSKDDGVLQGTLIHENSETKKEVRDHMVRPISGLCSYLKQWGFRISKHISITAKSTTESSNEGQKRKHRCG